MAEEYVDDDLSAYSGKARPSYSRMLEQIRNRERDAVIVWHVDRLTRRPIELEEFALACTVGGVTDIVTLHGNMNLSSGDGLLMARFMAAGAAWESDNKSRRSKRKMLELAEAGKPHGGGPRPFGFNDDRMTINEAEADAIREIVVRFLAGESIASLVRWLDEAEVRTATGKTWRSPTVRNLLLSPRIAGLREHQGQVIGKAAWPAIITPEQHAQAVAILSNPSRRTNRAARRYLLSGLLRCGVCGQRLYSMSRHEYDTRRYLCRSGPNWNNGCGKITVTAPPVEELISQAVLMRLDSEELAKTLEGRYRADETSAMLSEEIAADDKQLQDLAKMFGNREISATEWRAAREPIERRLQANRRRQTAQSGLSILDGYIGNGAALERNWNTLNLDRQRAIIAAVLDHAIIHPATQRGLKRLDPSRVEPRWRL